MRALRPQPAGDRLCVSNKNKFSHFRQKGFSATKDSPSRPAWKSAHRNVASNNLRRLQRINSQDERVSLRVEGDRTPERLQLAADEACF